MADRLKFKYIRVKKVLEIGDCTVDVLDPSNSDEIAFKLEARDFASFLPRAIEIQEDSWSFQPKDD